LKSGALLVIPYPRNQQVGVRGILRVDRKFRSHRPQQFRRAYRKRVAVERVFSRLKNLASLTQHNLREVVQSNVSFSTLRPNYASHSPSSYQHAQIKQGQKHQILRKLISGQLSARFMKRIRSQAKIKRQGAARFGCGCGHRTLW